MPVKLVYIWVVTYNGKVSQEGFDTLTLAEDWIESRSGNPINQRSPAGFKGTRYLDDKKGSYEIHVVSVRRTK